MSHFPFGIEIYREAKDPMQTCILGSWLPSQSRRPDRVQRRRKGLVGRLEGNKDGLYLLRSQKRARQWPTNSDCKHNRIKLTYFSR